MVLAGGTASRKLDLDAFIRQAVRLRGVGARLGQARADADRARADARVPGQARRGADAVGAQRRVRPDRRRRVHRAAATPSTRAPRPATPSSSTPSASGRSSARPAPASEKAGDKVADAAAAHQRLAARRPRARLISGRSRRRRARDAAAADRQPVAARAPAGARSSRTRPSTTAIRLRCTRTQRRPTRRSNSTVTRADGGLIVPRTPHRAAAPRARAGDRQQQAGDDADGDRRRTPSAGACASPANTARTLRAVRERDARDPAAVGAARPRRRSRVQAEPAAWNSTSIGSAAGGRAVGEAQLARRPRTA